MEPSKENLVDSTAQASGEVVKTDTVAYESFKKSVEAEKKARERAQQLETELSTYKTKELEAQGKYEEITQTLKQQLQEEREALKKEREANAWRTVTSAIKTEAIKHGCLDPDDLIKVLNKSDFEKLRSVDGSIDSDSLTALIDDTKKRKVHFFDQAKITVNDVVPRTGEPEKVEMTENEMFEKYIATLK